MMNLTTPAAPPPVFRPSTTPAATVLLALGVVALGFVVFQGASTVVLLAALLSGGVALPELANGFNALVADRPVFVLVANAVGQVMGLALVALVAARIHTRRPRAFLRIASPPPWGMMGAAVLGVLALIPVVQLLAGWNSLLPLPPFLEQLEEAREALLSAMLANPTGWLTNLVLLALTPAICEELLFRGYFQGQLYRVMRPLAAVLVSGIVFGMFHLVPTQLLPLSVLGIYMAYVVWRTGSLWTGIAVHFAHNGTMVLLAPQLEGGTAAEATIGFPAAITLGATVAAAALIFWLHRTSAAHAFAPAPPADVYPATIHSLDRDSHV